MARLGYRSKNTIGKHILNVYDLRMRSRLNNPSIQLYLLPFMGGLLYAMGYPMTFFPHFFLAPVFATFIFFLAIPISFGRDHDIDDFKKSSLKKELLTLLSFSLGYCLLGYYWIPYTFKEFGDIPFPINYLLGGMFSLIITPHLLIFIISHRFLRKLNIKRFKSLSSTTMRCLILAFILTMLERFTPQQFPGHLGHAWLQLAPRLGLAPIFGYPIYSFISFLLVFTLLAKVKTKKWDIFNLGLVSLFLFANLILPIKWNPEENPTNTNIRMVQGNIGNFLKLQSEDGTKQSITQVLHQYYQLSTKPSEVFNDIDLVVWPETAYPSLLNSSLLKTMPTTTPTIFQAIIKHNNSYLFTGGYDRSVNQNENYFETEYNAAFLFDRNTVLNDFYHKRILIPFGESLPFGSLNTYFSKIIKNISFFAPGNRFSVFELDNRATFISAICYEILFTSYIMDYLRDTDKPIHFLVNLTNDSWYGKTNEPWQHKFLAHWRALEFQIPIVRMTNTGISSFLFPDGSESRHLELFKPGILDYSLKTRPQSGTIYQRYGIFSFLIFYFSILFIYFLKSLLLKGRED